MRGARPRTAPAQHELHSMPVSPAPWKKEKVGAAEVALAADLLHMTWPRNKSSRVAPAAHEEAAAAAATAMIPASSDPTMLNLSCRGLSSWPSAVHLDSRLVHLYLNDNQLTELPEAIGRLRSLWQLFVHDNRLLELPASIGQLRALWELDAHSNQLTALPLSLAKCTSLRRLDVSDNLFSLTLSLGWLGKLRSLRLAQALFDSIDGAGLPDEQQPRLDRQPACTQSAPASRSSTKRVRDSDGDSVLRLAPDGDSVLQTIVPIRKRQAIREFDDWLKATAAVDGGS